MAPRTLVDTLFLLGPKTYDFQYKRGAPWERGPRPELADLIRRGRISLDALAPGRAIDLGCGSGADTLLLARQGWDVTGVDFSSVAIAKARVASRVPPPDKLPRFVVADLLDLPNGDVRGPFDLLIDGGTLDDFPVRLRPRLAERYTALARPGSVLVLCCSYGSLEDVPRFSLSRSSRWGAPPLAAAEEERLFGDNWSIERLAPEDEAPGSACFVMTRLSNDPVTHRRARR